MDVTEAVTVVHGDRGPGRIGERRAEPVKRRRRGVSGGELVVALAESQVVGGECFDDIEELRADRAGACLRAVAQVPAAGTALQLAKRLRRCLGSIFNGRSSDPPRTSIRLRSGGAWGPAAPR